VLLVGRRLGRSLCGRSSLLRLSASRLSIRRSKLARWGWRRLRLCRSVVELGRLGYVEGNSRSCRHVSGLHRLRGTLLTREFQCSDKHNSCRSRRSRSVWANIQPRASTEIMIAQRGLITMATSKKGDSMAADQSTIHESDLDNMAGNGLLHRRMFLTAGTAAAAAIASSALPNPAAADALPVEPWMQVPGSGFVGLRPAIEIRRKGRQNLEHCARHDRHGCRAHTAPFARRYDHAQRGAFRAFS